MAREIRSRKSVATRSFGDLILNVAAIGGLLCIVLVALAFTMNITLIMFKTGSMSPTIPAGSVALVQKVPANSISVGDIVTVDRAGKLPITHRVTSIDPPGSGDSRTFTMRGDANPVDDAELYTATSVRIVRGHLPGVAPVIVWFSHPVVLGALTLGAAGLVTWAFWPREEKTDGTDGADMRDDAEDTLDTDPTEPAETMHVDNGDLSGKSTLSSGTRGVALTVAILAVVSAMTLTTTEQAFAAETETHIDSTVLKLTSINDPVLMSQMTPGVPVYWQVGVRAVTSEPGLVTIGLSASGDAANAQKLTVAIDSCAVRWVAATCTTGQQTLVAPQLLADALLPQAPDGTRTLTTMPSAEQRWLRIAVTLAGAVQSGFSETIHVHANGFGDDVSTDDENGNLAFTGAPNLSGVVALALGTVLAGVAVAWFAAFRRRKRT